MKWRNLMDSAREQAGQTRPQPPGRPRQEPLKRAVSSAYYAMFHALCRSNADAIVGRRDSAVSSLAWNRTYRALDHRQAKNRLERVKQQLPIQARNFAIRFAILQDLRHSADYDPDSTFERVEVIYLLDTANTAIEDFMRMPGNDRRAVAALVLLQERTAG